MLTCLPQLTSARMRSIDQVRKVSGQKRPELAPVSAEEEHRSTAATPGQKRKFSNLPSAPNGAPLIAADEERDVKRKRLSWGPNAIGSLRGAGRSLVNVIGEQIGAAPTPRRLPASVKKAQRKRRSSVTAGKGKPDRASRTARLLTGLGRGLASRFGFLNRKKRVSRSAQTPPTALIVSNPRSLMTSSNTSSTRPTISSSMRDQGAVSQLRSASGRPQAGQSNNTRQQKNRAPSTSAPSVLSTTSRIKVRPKLPEFGAPAVPVSTGGSVNAIGLPVDTTTKGSVSSTMSARKQSQAEIIRKARPAPAPPAAMSLGKVELTATGAVKDTKILSASTSSTANKRVSTLTQPTAASTARMQATVKPSLDRPLPSLPKPKIETSKPFGRGSSRDDSTFDTSFNVPKPFLPPPSAFPSPPQHTALTRVGGTTPGRLRGPLRSTTNLKSPGKSPRGGSVAGQRAREKAGMNIKARGDTRAAMEATHKRVEVKARQERLAEERALRDMLGGNFVMGE